jgi:hypothetical protein
MQLGQVAGMFCRQARLPESAPDELLAAVLLLLTAALLLDELLAAVLAAVLLVLFAEVPPAPVLPLLTGAPPALLLLTTLVGAPGEPPSPVLVLPPKPEPLVEGAPPGPEPTGSGLCAHCVMKMTKAVRQRPSTEVSGPYSRIDIATTPRVALRRQPLTSPPSPRSSQRKKPATPQRNTQLLRRSAA